MTDLYEIVIVQAEAAKRGALAIWTVYEKPKDYPIGWIARSEDDEPQIVESWI